MKILYIFLLLFISLHIMNAQSQNEFDINDPRNPNCPCHKHQQLADEEYKKLLASAHPNQQQLNVSGHTVAGNSSTKQERTNKLHHHQLLFTKRTFRHMRKNWQRSISSSFIGKIKRSVKTDLCYHWR